MGYSQEIYLEQRFTPTIKAILGCQFITQVVDHDLHNATDFEMFIVKPFTVGVRLRRFKYYRAFKDQFTIRWAVSSGAMTEIDKIRSGLVDYILYGFVNKEEDKIIQYFIGDLTLFRKNEPKPVGIFDNGPGDSKLAAYSLNALPPEFVLKFWTADKRDGTFGRPSALE